MPSVVMFFFVGQRITPKPMVNHDQKGIEAGGRGGVSDKVT